MTLPALTFECYQMESGVWCKRRANGLRGACVADEAILWQHLQAAQAAQAALGQKPPPSVDIEELVRENEQLARDCARLIADGNTVRAQATDLHNRVEDMKRENERLTKENDALLANQRKKPGRKSRSDAAGAEDQALAASEQEQDPLGEDL